MGNYLHNQIGIEEAKLAKFFVLILLGGEGYLFCLNNNDGDAAKLARIHLDDKIT